jgi:SAM-dependent methyltransferase
MTEQTIRFDDGAAYEQMMGVWSAKAGAVFLDWLAPQQGLRWIDVGCGNGAFTQLIVERTAPAEIEGVDPSEGQLAFARARQGVGRAQFQLGDAMALPFPEARFDVAVMALVLVFVPDPAKGVAEMVRVVKPGGIVAAYMWDMMGGGFPLDHVNVALQAMEIQRVRPPQVEASRLAAMRDLWAGAGLAAIETREIVVERSYADFDDYWATALKSPALGPLLAGLAPDVGAALQEKVRASLPSDRQGRITHSARAHAISGRKRL